MHECDGRDWVRSLQSSASRPGRLCTVGVPQRPPDSRQREQAAHLRGDVIRGSTEGPRHDPFVDVLLAHAEVCDLYVALRVEHDVVQLQIP